MIRLGKAIVAGLRPDNIEHLIDDAAKSPKNVKNGFSTWIVTKYHQGKKHVGLEDSQTAAEREEKQQIGRVSKKLQQFFLVIAVPFISIKFQYRVAKNSEVKGGGFQRTLKKFSNTVAETTGIQDVRAYTGGLNKFDRYVLRLYV